jgi:hypothetical protein
VASSAWQHAVVVAASLWSWAELMPALLANRPTAMAANDARPYQALTIRSLGFQLPDTVVATNPDIAPGLGATEGSSTTPSAAFEASSSQRGPDHEPRRDNIGCCPTQL